MLLTPEIVPVVDANVASGYKRETETMSSGLSVASWVSSSDDVGYIVGT